MRRTNRWLAVIVMALLGFTAGCKTDKSLREERDEEKKAAAEKRKAEKATENAANAAEESRIAVLDVEAARKSPAVIEDSIGGLFVNRVDGTRTVSAALEHVLQIGPAATPYLVEILKAKAGDGTAEWMRKFGLSNGVPEWRWRTGMRVALVLAQIRDPEAAEAMLQDMAERMGLPDGLPEDKEAQWNAVQRNRIKFDGWGLASVFPKDLHVDALRIMRDPKVDAEARLQLGLALAFHFTPDSSLTLARTVWEDVDFEDKLDDELPPPARTAVFVTRFVQLLAYSIDYERLPLFERLFGEDIELTFGDLDGFESVAARIQEPDVQLLLLVPQACMKDLACYKSVLEGKGGQAKEGGTAYTPADVDTGDADSDEYLRTVARTKAALVISRFDVTGKDAQDLFDFVVQVYKVLPYNDAVNIDLRRGLLLCFERLGAQNPAKAAEAMAALEAHEGTLEGNALVVWNQRLRGLRYFFEAKLPQAKPAGQ